MELEQFKISFFELVAPDLPNEWDVDEAIESLDGLATKSLVLVLEQVQVIWPVSNSLCYSYLTQVSDALDCIEPDLLSQWVNETLDHYERSGLKAAQRFMMDVQGHFVCRLQGKSGLRYSQVEGRMLPYARGLARGNLDLDRADFACTDTTTLFLPREFSLCTDETENFLLYKLTVSFQWSFIALGSFLVSRNRDRENPSAQGVLWLQEYFSEFSNPGLIADIYHSLETLRAKVFLAQELPGLMRDAVSVLTKITGVSAGSDRVTSFFATLQQLILGRKIDSADCWLQQVIPLLTVGATALDSLALADEIYGVVYPESDEFKRVEPLPFQGRMQLEQVTAARLNQRHEQESLFVESLATLLLSLVPESGDAGNEKEAGPGQESGQAAPPDDPVAMVMLGNKNRAEDEENNENLRFITVDNREIELSEELAELAETITRDLGHIPDQYISSAAGKAGQGSPGLAMLAAVDGTELSAPITYDEWDFRRSGFRKNWCIVTEKEIPVTRSTFIRNTLDAYHGQIIRLRHQFEMMRTRERFVRRQRDGDDIDLDALVESLADTVAGHPPSDRLFIRLKRDERDIAALFLVDMSNSTRGWVGKAIKESLVLICEAMETLGDRYGIYGFSGMRRLRCEIFPIKNIDQSYNDEVRERIGSIAPREYTRMAPAIRHMTSILKDVDAKVRLLITLSDGKPEDYDEYKGEYAIEDTRHALIEAKIAGIHPFCITIDQHAHEYMAHMYGEVNYIFINDVSKLPARMPEIYRVLTS
ncbi:MAG: VWA domain-containing protein [Deltaproteobacteria bacterium]|nr:VWA domain-containing protein [Deltaproteobacteria bacterium]